MVAKDRELLERAERVKRKVVAKQLRLGCCLTEPEIEQFEQRHRIRLPDAYRLFLLHIGNGGDGPPHYGLVPLHLTVPADSGFGEALAPDEPFPLAGTWVWEYEIDWEKEPPDKLRAVFRCGHLFLGTDGCGMDWILVVVGAERGHVWQRTGAGASPGRPRRDFLDWYEYWLDSGDDWDGMNWWNE